MTQKQYSIRWEDDIAVSFEVDGVTYDSLDDVPNERDRRKLEAMMDSSFDLELEHMSRTGGQGGGVNVEKVILSVFSGVAALMLLIAGIASYNNILKLSREASAPGRVVEVVEQRQYVNEQDRIIETYYYPVVEFTASDGKRRSVQMSEGSSLPEYEAGDEVTVLYNPDRPLDARIKSFGSSALMWVLPGITGILGLAFLGAVIAVRKFMPVEE